MTIVCAWCQKVLRRGSGPVSHGICGRCAEAFMVGAGPLVLTANPGGSAPTRLRKDDK